MTSRWHFKIYKWKILGANIFHIVSNHDWHAAQLKFHFSFLIMMMIYFHHDYFIRHFFRKTQHKPIENFSTKTFYFYFMACSDQNYLEDIFLLSAKNFWILIEFFYQDQAFTNKIIYIHHIFLLNFQSCFQWIVFEQYFYFFEKAYIK